MARNLFIDYDYSEDFAIVAPVKRCDLESFNCLLGHLFHFWQKADYQIDLRCRTLIERIANLLPRIDIQGTGISVDSLSVESLEGLFIGEVKNDELLPSRLMKLQEFRIPSKKKIKKDGEPLTPEDVPINSSGLEFADTLATLISVDDGVLGALRMCEELDAHTINATIFYLNELRRDPKDRLNEYLNEQFEEWKRENQQAYQSAIFG